MTQTSFTSWSPSIFSTSLILWVFFCLLIRSSFYPHWSAFKYFKCRSSYDWGFHFKCVLTSGYFRSSDPDPPTMIGSKTFAPESTLHIQDFGLCACTWKTYSSFHLWNSQGRWEVGSGISRWNLSNKGCSFSILSLSMWHCPYAISLIFCDWRRTATVLMRPSISQIQVRTWYSLSAINPSLLIEQFSWWFLSLDWTIEFLLTLWRYFIRLVAPHHICPPITPSTLCIRFNDRIFHYSNDFGLYAWVGYQLSSRVFPLFSSFALEPKFFLLMHTVHICSPVSMPWWNYRACTRTPSPLPYFASSVPSGLVTFFTMINLTFRWLSLEVVNHPSQRWCLGLESIERLRWKFWSWAFKHFTKPKHFWSRSPLYGTRHNIFMCLEVTAGLWKWYWWEEGI